MTKMKCSQALIKILEQEGVEYIFGIPGATEIQFMDALEDCDTINYRLCLHENTAIGMAEGYARASDKVAFVNLHTNTGLASSLGMLSNCYCGGVPVIVTAGQQDTRLHASEPALFDDLVTISSPFTKWGTELKHAQDLPMIMRRAFKASAHSPAGPVFISLPQNLLTEEIELEYSSGAPAYTNVHPDKTAINEAVKLLVNAKNPMMIVEDGVAKNNALTEVVQLAELTGATVYQPWMSDVNFPVNHPLYRYDLNVNSIDTRKLIEQADVLIVIGALFFGQAIYVPQSLVPATTKVIQIDNNPWQIGKNYPVECGIEGNIKTAVSDLNSALEETLTAADRQAVKARIQEITLEKEAMVKEFNEKAAAEKDNEPISGSRLMMEIAAAIQPGTRIVDDCWSYSSILRRVIPFTEPKSYMRARGGGSIGWGLSGAQGVKLSDPEKPVLCVSGDGSAMWNIQSLWTAARYNIPVTFIIMANGCYRQVRLMKTLLQVPNASSRILGTDLRSPQNDICKIAEGMGVSAQRVANPNHLKDTLKDALEMKTPNVIEVIVDDTI